MKRKPYKQITVYNVVNHIVFINDNKSEDHFPTEKNDNYFNWSDCLDTKLKEYNELSFDENDLGDADGIEKVLWCATIPTKLWNKIKNKDDAHEYISNEVDYNFVYLKSKFWDWEHFMSNEELSELKKELC